MKKLLLTALILVLLVPLAHARGAVTQNSWASWVNMSGDSMTTWQMPLVRTGVRYKTRDIWIRNGDATVDVCVDLKGGTITGTCLTNDINTHSIFMLDADSEIHFDDYLTDTITALAVGADASPVSIIVTW